MPSMVIVGAQWGDEGKGKLVDFFSQRANFVARFQGGSNAGHTLVVDGRKTKLNLIPSGILREHTVCAIGAGAVLDPKRLAEELAELQEAGVRIEPGRLLIDERVQLVLPYHRLLDSAREEQLGSKWIGTTGRGVGPTYADRINRIGIMAGELRRLDILREKLERLVKERNHYLNVVLNSSEQVNFDEIWELVESSVPVIEPHLCQVGSVIDQAIQSNKCVLFEGAQGTLLDNCFGTFPFVTSSHTIAGAACVGIGVGPTRIDGVVGVAKSYCTRVGAGPFPTEDHGTHGDFLRERGGEYGTVTKRPRRCGWLDLVALKESLRLSGVDCLAITKLDVLSGLETIKVAVSYRTSSGDEINQIPVIPEEYESVNPVYREFPGWSEDLTSLTHWSDLPKNALNYLEFLESELRVPIEMVSVGAERSATLVRKRSSVLDGFLDR